MTASCVNCKHWDQKVPSKRGQRQNWASSERLCRQWRDFFTRPDYLCRIWEEKEKRK